jgi:hypothetical protein
MKENSKKKKKKKKKTHTQLTFVVSMQELGQPVLINFYAK